MAKQYAIEGNENSAYESSSSGIVVKIIALTVVAIGLIVFFTLIDRVHPGYVGVIVHSLGSEQGVDIEPVGIGYHYVGWFSTLYEFPVYTKTKDDYEPLQFQSEGMMLGSNFALSYHVEGAKAPILFQKYRLGIEEITNVVLYNMIGNEIGLITSDMKIEDVHSTKKKWVLETVEKNIKAQVAPIGLIIEKIYWKGGIKLPDVVQNSVNAKIQATQEAIKVENQVREATASARKIEEAAKGNAAAIELNGKAQAAANHAIAESITPQLIEFTKAQAFAMKWDGAMPRMTGSNPIPFINADTLTEPKQKNPAN